MAIVSDVAKKVEIPHEPGEWMELKRLSWRQLEKAAEVQTDALMERMKKMGGDLVGALQEIGDREREQKRNQDPLERYDRAAVLRAGVLRWSYKADVSEENIDGLDEETAAWAFKEILELNKPKTEEERKNA